MATRGERYRWYETTFWEEVTARSEQVADEEDDAVPRAGVYFNLYSFQLIFVLTPFWPMPSDRAPSDADGWLSERVGVETSGLGSRRALRLPPSVTGSSSSETGRS